MATSFEGLVWQHRGKKAQYFLETVQRFSEPFNPISVFWQSSSIKYFLTIKDVTGALRRVLWHFSFQQPPQCCPDSLPNPVDLLSRGERYEQQTWLLFKLGFESSELPMGNFSSRFWSPYSFSPFISAWTVLTATCTCTNNNKFVWKTF